MSKWPERKRDFVAKHGGSVAANLAFDFATVIKAAVEADIHDRPELDLNSVKNIKNKSVERIAEEILPDGVPIFLDISVSTSCGLSGGSENKNNNAGGNNKNTGKNNNEKSGVSGSDKNNGGGENSEKEGSAGQGGRGSGKDEDYENFTEKESGFENFDIEDIIADGILFANSFGAGYASIGERVFSELNKNKVDVWRIIEGAILNGCKNVRRTWRRLNRKLPNIIPGREYMGSDAMVIIDSSGSITEEELKKFGEILNRLMRSGGRFHILSFSGDAIDHGINPDVKKLKMRSGGTEPACLVPYLKRYKPRFLIMMTDGQFYGEYDAFLKAVRKIPQTMLITTGEKYSEFKRIFKLER